MSQAIVLCQDGQARRARTRAAKLFGVDFVELSSLKQLSVYFLGRAPAHLPNASIRIEGGRRERDLKVLSMRIETASEEDQDDRMIVDLDRAGDASTYTLRIAALNAQGVPTTEAPSDFDPRYDRASFSFALDCATDLDCAASPACLEDELPHPDLDYLAKDYGSFRQLMLDRMALLAPDWKERHAPDLGLTLVELIAYLGDQLSYYQDAAATEAYLDTARLRVSVRRHLRLVDYLLHEGCNARAWLSLSADQDLKVNADDLFVVASCEANASPMLPEQDWRERRTARHVVFEPVVRACVLALTKERSEIRIHDWQGQECCIPRGATCATLVDPGIYPDPPADDEGDECAPKPPPAPSLEGAYRLGLKVCDVLIFEEVRGAKTGLPADADPTHRHAVRLTRVDKRVDPVPDPRTGKPVLLWEICWHEEDALPFPVCLSSTGPAPDCLPLTDVSVVRGNVILVDHGETHVDNLGDVPVNRTPLQCADECESMETEARPGRFRPRLDTPELTHREPVEDCPVDDACAGHAVPRSAASLFRRDPRLAVPQVSLRSVDPNSAGAGEEVWTVRRDLLESAGTALEFVAEMDDNRLAQLRFGDDVSGRAAPAGAHFRAQYRVGNGSEGNVGAGALDQLVFRNSYPNGVQLRATNPLPARGGQRHEAVDDAKRRGPQAFRRELTRAITPEDYARIVERDFASKVQRATAVIRWNGYRAEVHVAIDPLQSAACDQTLLCRIARHLDGYRRLGHVVHVVPATPVPIRLALDVCVRAHHPRAQVAAALRELFSNRSLANGKRGFFHAENLSFAHPIRVSQVVALAQATAGVSHVRASALERFWESSQRALSTGVLEIGALEVAQLDNDPSVPEHGVLTLALSGGR